MQSRGRRHTAYVAWPALIEEEGRSFLVGWDTVVEKFNDGINTEASDADRRWGPVTPPVGWTNYLLIYPLISPLIPLISACFLQPTEGGPFFTGHQS